MADLDITLNGKPATLKWKLPVSKNIAKEFGGFLPAHRAITEFDLDAFVKVVAIGTERVMPDAAEEIEADVFATGMETLQPDLLRFLNRLVSGGKDPELAAAAA
ncbi:hypothetical protein [Tardiphaga sp. 841_E9_N1_2]|uniref:hypothetical protein n=1 Tax=Tardiphaga sp. 841_E9_N1_2 TaxID=3240762 RepID=UPI003F291DD5